MALKRIGAGDRMSDAVIHGDKIYLSGYIAEKAVGKSVKEQTKDILDQIDATLKQAGTDKTRILIHTATYLLDLHLKRAAADEEIRNKFVMRL